MRGAMFLVVLGWFGWVGSPLIAGRCSCTKPNSGLYGILALDINTNSWECVPDDCWIPV